MRRHPRKRGVRPGIRAGKPNYSLPNRYYPEYIPVATKGISAPLIGYWHMRRRIRWMLGYIPIDGIRNDAWTTYDADKIAQLCELMEIADQKLAEGEKEYYAKLKEKEKKEYDEIRKGILSDVYDQTDAFLEKRKSEQNFSSTNEVKQCLNQGAIDMAKMSFEEMMEWSKKQKDYEGSGVNFLKTPQGIHCIRLLSGEDEDYFATYTQHDCGSGKDFRSWMCWDFIIDNKEIADYFEEKELITEEQVKRIKKLGCPNCSTLDVIGKYVKNMKPFYDALRTKTRAIMNVFYIFQAYPEISDQDRSDGKFIKPGNYILEKSAGFNKLIISAMNKQVATSMEEDLDPLDLISAEKGMMIALQVEGEGIGKNKRTYTIDFKGKPGPIVYTEEGTNPYVKGAKRLPLPDDFQIYNFHDVMALRFLPYQECINQMKTIPAISKVLEQLGYTIPGDEPSDNPLDDNYDKTFAQKTVGKPIKSINEDSPLSKMQNKKKEKWEDEEEIVKDKKKVAKIIEVVEDDDDDIPFDEDELDVDEFTKKVPPSDPKKEVITNAPKGKRKIF